MKFFVSGVYPFFSCSPRRHPLLALLCAVMVCCTTWASAGAQEGRDIQLDIRANQLKGDAHQRIGDFMKLEMVFNGDAAETGAYKSVGFTGEKATGFFSPQDKDEGYGAFVVTVLPPGAETAAPAPRSGKHRKFTDRPVVERLEDRVQISTVGFDAMMKDFHSTYGRYITTFNLNEMPIALASPECVKKVGLKYAAGCSPADHEMWRIAVTKALKHIATTYGTDAQLQLFGEVESREVFRGFGARNFDEYADNEDFRQEEERLSDDYFRLAVATARAVKKVNDLHSRHNLVTLASSGVYSQQLMRDINGGQPRNGTEAFLERMEAYNSRNADSPLIWPTAAMGVQLYEWDGTGTFSKGLAHLGALTERYGLPFYVYGYNLSWTREGMLPPHMNGAYVLAGNIQMFDHDFMKEGYGYTWTRVSVEDDGRHTIYNPDTGKINAFGAAYQALGRLRGTKGTRFAEVTRSGSQTDAFQAAATVGPDGTVHLLAVNNSAEPQTVAISVSGMPHNGSLPQQFWHIGPADDGHDYSAAGLNDLEESATFERIPAEPITLTIMPYASLLVKTWPRPDAPSPAAGR